MYEDWKNDLEVNIVDRQGLRRVCEALSEICRDKAEHVRTVWEDRILERQWNRAAKLFDALTSRLPDLP